MGIWDKIRGELIDIIEWLDDGKNTLAWRFERYGNEIKNGAKLIVREGQAAVFVREGKIADVFQPGTYTLDTKNLPILSTILGWKYGFESPFKAEVYFITTRRFTDLKWGTKNPVMLRDAEFGPVRLRAFGTYVIKVNDPAVFIREVVGTDGHFTAEGITRQLRNLVVSRFTDVLGESKIPVLDLAGNYDELGEFLTERIASDFTTHYGIELTQMLVENISLPPAVEEALDKRTSMGVIGDLKAYTQFQAANAMEKAAANPSGGGAADGIGLGMGFAMAQHMGKMMSQQSDAPPAAAGGGADLPPPLPEAPSYWVAGGGERRGPFAMAALAEQVAGGTLTRQTLVWCKGMAAWTPAEMVPALAPLFEEMPPPLPPMG
ncbi:MAG: SPFH domain-containing protein [Planctomycetota bacterium]